ncbi:KluB [Thioclava sp. JM3]|uniref:KluB n=1 Tax=Thioclava sp. JM3 TaxID=1973004 RepID=UPI000B5396D2|nr:KluB [Thioclava sp. JM3]OWY10441.1 KluB [Thioclava sp. JM3]
MAHEVLRARALARDLEQIFDYLISAAEGFGEYPESAFALVERRIAAIEADLDAFGTAPHQGTLRPELGAGVRNVTKGRAVFYFDLDEAAATLRVLAVFFGGQDHQTRMLLRSLRGP